MAAVREGLLETCEAAVAAALADGATEAEACASRTRSVEVVLQKSDMQMAKSGMAVGLGVRVLKSGRLGFAFSNRLDDASIAESVRAALGIAAASPADAHNRLPDPAAITYRDGLYDPGAEYCRVEEAVDAALAMLAEALRYDARVSVDWGEYGARWGERGVASSRGVRACERSSAFHCGILGMARDGDVVSSFDYQYDGARAAGGVDPVSIARRFAENVVGSLGALKGEGFTGSVILSPKAVAHVVCYPIEASVSARSVQKGTSRFKDKLGVAVASPSLTLIDDAALPGGLGSASFDREGVPPETLPLIERGVLRNFLYDGYSSSVDGRRSNGHAGGGPSDVPHVAATNVVMGEGSAALADLIAGVDRGVLVTRFSGNVDPVSGDFSGAVKGGRAIRGGKLAEPLCGTMVAGNTFDLLPAIAAVSRERESMPGALLGHVLIEGVVVSGG